MPQGTPYAKMTAAQKVKFICKLTLSILSFGFLFPNVMSE